MRQLTLDLQPAAPPSLENYVTGSNGEALTALAAWLAADNREALFFLCGERGAGKSHLLQACADAYGDARLDPGLAQLPATADIWAVDHLEMLDDGGQIVLFNLINRLRTGGGRLLLAASLPPRLLELREDLRTRLASGLVYRLRCLSDREKRAAFAAQARARGLDLSPAVIDYLFARAPRDMRSLTQLLRAIDQFSLEHQRPITVPLLREVLQTSPPT